MPAQAPVEAAAAAPATAAAPAQAMAQADGWTQQHVPGVPDAASPGEEEAAFLRRRLAALQEVNAKQAADLTRDATILAQERHDLLDEVAAYRQAQENKFLGLLQAQNNRLA